MTDTTLTIDRPTWRRQAEGLFAIDPRSLALCRIGLGLVLLANLATRSWDLEAHYTDQGAIPRDTVRLFCESFGQSYLWSIHMLGGSTGFAAFMFVLSALFAAALVAGYRTRWATVGSWILLGSLHARTPLLANGGDVLLAMLLLWGMFLPLGRRWSVDAWRAGLSGGCGAGERKAEPSREVLSVATAGILVQVFCMYFFTGVGKLNGFWFSGTALENALGYDMFVRPGGHLLRQFTFLLPLLTWGTLALELGGPFLLFWPVNRKWIRGGAIVAFLGMHAGIELTMTVCMFSFAALCGLALFVPKEMWDEWLIPFAQARRATATRAAGGGNLAKDAGSVLHAGHRGRQTWPANAARLLHAAVCGFFLLFVLSWNLAQVASAAMQVPQPLSAFESMTDEAPAETRPADEGMDSPPAVVQGYFAVAQFFRLSQNWSMFSTPQDADLRFIADGRLADGKRIDLLRGGAPISGDYADNPESLSPAMSSGRWMTYFMAISAPQGNLPSRWFAPDVGEYLRRDWNRRHGRELQVEEMDLRLVAQGRFPGMGKEMVVERPLEVHVSYDGEWCGRVRHGEWILRHADGAPSGQGRFEFGSRVGPWVHWNRAGAKISAGRYAHDKKDGVWEHWHDNGVMSMKGAYAEGREDGYWKLWREDGSLESEGSFRDGQFHGRWTFYENGTALHVNYRDGAVVAGGS